MTSEPSGRRRRYVATLLLALPLSALLVAFASVCGGIHGAPTCGVLTYAAVPLVVLVLTASVPLDALLGDYATQEVARPTRFTAIVYQLPTAESDSIGAILGKAGVTVLA